jgi:Rrf2 family transcriptional regulator, repressor of oqxAB
MIGELFASVPGQRPVKFAGQSLRLLDKRRDDAFGILICDLDQHHVARMALDKCYDIAVPRSTNQVALPVAWDRTIFNRCRSFSDGYGILDLAEPVPFQAGVSGAAPHGLQTNPTFIRKLLVPLTQEGIIVASVGKGGGLHLGRPAERISLCEVYLAATSEKKMFARREILENRCRISAHFNEFFEAITDEARSAMMNALAGRSIADSLDEVLILGLAKGRAPTSPVENSRRHVKA